MKHPGTNRCVQHPNEEWIIVPDSHEAIITRVGFDAAHDAIRKEKLSDVPIDHIFHGKVKCPVCNHTLKRSIPRNPYFKCSTRYFTDHYDCPDRSISQAEIEKAVLDSIKVYAATLIECEELALAAIQQDGISKAVIESKVKQRKELSGSLKNLLQKYHRACVGQTHARRISEQESNYQ